MRRIKTNDRNLDQVQTNVAQIIDPISKVQLLKGILIENVTITSGGTTIDHLLKRQPLGWMIVDTNTASTIYRTAWSVNTITLVAGTTTVASIWIF